ncbi:PPOX class F420-dependent oxidoreductase [Nocardia sp. NPDC057663]|uniref:PPOX class F420-dependent oxidoreductase n=1 Tax=Nocardia sp. NPDC057663 TaxID=3346201 RepID=UPI00366EC6C2
MTAGSSEWDAVGGSTYVSFTSYRKNGTPVSLPVWIAPADGKLYFLSEANAYKVKRIRRNPEVSLQSCRVRGKIDPGSPIVEGTARVLGDEDTSRVRKIMNRKYWILGPLSEFGAWIARRQGATIGIEISPLG